MPAAPRRNLILALVSTALSIAGLLYGFEIVLGLKQRALVRQHCEFFGITEKRTAAAKRLGAEVSVNGRWYRELNLEPPPNHPIGTHPNARVIGFREGDGHDWPVHQTDRFGFFNENCWWDDPEVVLVGDSFVTCEHLQTVSITQLLRARGIKAVNVGLTGSGPLLQLAALKSRRAELRNVRAIFWTLYDGNDWQDATEENEVARYRAALLPDYAIFPDQSLLKTLPSTDDTAMFGWRYVVSSALSLKRVRNTVQRMRSGGAAVRIWNDCLAEAGRSVCPEITLIEIGQIGTDTQRLWRALHAPRKLRFPSEPKFHSGGLPLTHLNAAGYEVLAQLMASR